MEDITIEELHKRLAEKKDFVFIDVREEWEYEEANLGARLLPLGQLAEKMPELEPLKNDEIIIHCKSGGRSGQAKEFLTAMGFTKARNVLGGILRWHELYGKEKP